jgi:hypothetical protein
MTFDELESPKAFLPGVKARHVVISTACREAHGDVGACEVAMRQVRGELSRLLASWSRNKGATFHLMLTVDRAGRRSTV